MTRMTASHTIDPNVVERYAQTMRDGEWRDGSMIILHDDRFLYDGHHRVSAVIASGVTIQVELVWRIPKTI